MMTRNLTALVLTLGLCAPASAATQFFATEADWLAAVNAATVERFDFTAANVALADGVVGPVLDRDEFGQQLDWQAANTGLSVDFRFNNSSFQNPSVIQWVDRDGGVLTSSPQVDHSWTLSITSASTFTALAFLVNGAGSFEDGLAIRNASGDVLGTFGGGPSGEAFAGFIFDEAFVSLAYEDHANIVGGKPLVRFSIANPIDVPEPGTLVLFAVGVAVLTARRGIAGRLEDPIPARVAPLT